MGIELNTVYHQIQSLLTNRGLKPSQHIMKNECPYVMKRFMREVYKKYQLVPPHIHRKSSAEQNIRTFKEHFIAGLSSTHKDLLLHIWCQLLPRASLTLNLI